MSVRSFYEHLEKELNLPPATESKKEIAGSPQEQAEELYALWRDYCRLKTRAKKEQLERLRSAMAGHQSM